MRAIIIGAGRGSRLMPTTADTPKCFAQVNGRRILDWLLAAFTANGIREVAFIGGYQLDRVRQEYPDFTFRQNTDWQNNNILESLMHAEDLMAEPFICCYSDTLFSASVVGRLLTGPGDICLAVDTQWQERYRHRSEHPSADAEKVTVSHGRVTRIHRDIEAGAAHGEFIGLSRFTPTGAGWLTGHYHRCKQHHTGSPFREAQVFEKAYLIQLYQEMVEHGVSLAHVDTAGQYMEIDTQEDFELAQLHWKG